MLASNPAPMSRPLAHGSRKWWRLSPGITDV
jgi:hypothetical protein